ncbi:MAG: GGDEF domain-containing protein [Rhodothermia bacterium]|nr:MAG: GGDEF domain-containing protein [Rhodothermia bacterium]
MLRVLLIILSVVSIILAYALQQWVLGIVALGFLAASATLTTVKMKKRHRDVPESFMKAPDVPVEDLSTLGIMEIRPKADGEDSSETVSDPQENGEEVQQELEFDEESGHTVKSNPVQPAGVSLDSTNDFIGQVRKRRPRTRVMVAEVAPEKNAEILIPVLRSLRAGLNAYTVCLLRQDNAPLRYHVEAIVSQNSYARGQGSFAPNEVLHTGYGALDPIIYPKVGTGGYPIQNLGYYHEPISVRQVAMVAVTSLDSQTPYLLVVDSMDDGGLESESVGVLLEQYAKLLATLLECEAAGYLDHSSVLPEPKKRREIIDDEMKRARTESHPLALALVYLNRGEDLGERGVTEIHELESAFEARIRAVADDGRVEQFGELTFGVFYHGEVDRVASWASRIQTSFVDERGRLQGGVSVGVAMLHARHKGPDDLRSDATAALQEAFESGECTIVE